MNQASPSVIRTSAGMRKMPLDIGTFHFVGIGGIGMSGIAEILHNLGYSVQGSDSSASANVIRLREKGIKIFEGHDPLNVKGADVLVISTAIRDDNPEVHTARKLALPIVRRAEMLGELMRLKWSVAVGGTHGKTTTTSLVASLLDAAGKDPTVINGGIINAYGTNARLGEGDWLVAEADESDGSFLRLPATISIVTNIDPEHLDHYGSVERLHQAFMDFVHNIPFYGMAVVCVDDPTVQSMLPKLGDRRVVTYGTSAQADVRAENIRHEDLGMRFDVRVRQRDADPVHYQNVYLPMFGEHNVLNALSALAIAHELGIDSDTIYKGFQNFGGVKRRFTHVGDAAGFTVIDDYGHHPVEISAVLKAARMAARDRKVIAVVQPHRYSRLKDLFEDFCTCFNDADEVIVADVHAAGESPLEGVDKESLVAGLRARGHRAAYPLHAAEDLAKTLIDHNPTGGFVVCLGAGSITQWANDLPQRLATATAHV